MSAAAAEIAGECLAHLNFRRTRRLGEQRGRAHDHAVGAIAALRRLLGDEGCLHGRKLLGRAQSFERGDFSALHRTDGELSRAHRLTVDDHRAGAALAEPATEFRTVQR